MDVLKTRFAEKQNANLPIFGIDKNHLKDFTTTEKDMKRGQNRFPPMQFRIKSEDLLREAEVKSDVVDSTYTLLDNYQENVELRNIQYQESKNFESTNDEEEEDGDDYDDPNREPTTRQVSDD